MKTIFGLGLSTTDGGVAPSLSFKRLAKLLLGSAASGALCLGAASIANADCIPSGNIINCTGDLSAGVSQSGANKTLNANSLSANPGSISLNGSGGNGDSGANGGGGDGDDGSGGTTTTLNYTGAPYTGGGLIARSNGGNGGGGGDGLSFTVPIPVPPFIIPVIIPGGDGGTGANGGSVTVASSGNLTTTGEGVHGILAEANGGNGGNGGDVYQVLGIYGAAGDGGQGGAGGSVSVTTTSGIITTQGKGGVGIFAQSNGGVGGRGGSIDGAGISGVGGNGAAPKNGGVVDVNNGGQIETYGLGGMGIVAQSIGGYAGSGGSSTSAIAFGGSGASAGDGNNVSVENSGSVHTRQADAHGIFAQSVGGGGGAGGYGGGVVSLGGSGGFGGAGKTVNVTNSATGTIVTEGARSAGILAQSVGGGGGDGGDSGGLVAIGGNSTGGGTGGIVGVSNAGSIHTKGVSSQAILAQSIGGGGGNGGTGGGLVPIGGRGGGGGDADIVTVTNTGSLETDARDSTALLAQSVGGGGGNGGGAFSGSAFVSFALGGSGGKGGDGKKATVNLSQNPAAPAQITTHAERSNGITVQSVGGGGGNGGSAVAVSVGYSGSLALAIGGSAGDGGKGGDVELNGYADINTGDATKPLQENSDGILAQSVGGGGGSGGYAISVSIAAGEGTAIAGAIGVGGSGGGGGAGGTVTVNAGGSIHTRNDKSEGLIAQSIGGGGGNGGYTVSIAGAAAGATAVAGAVGVGGSGGSGGVGGTVNATYNGNVTTDGKDSDAVIIQSVGGGGGNGGFTVAGAISAAGAKAGSLAIGVGGSGGTGGNSGVVTGTVTGNLTTNGNGSTALLVQSVGGGGGNGGFNVSGAIAGAGTGAGGLAVGVGGAGEGGGDGNTVTAKLTGNAETHGVDADAIVIQSLGGGGGNGGFNVSGAIGLAGEGSLVGSVGVGGSAGKGGDGKVVTADVIGNIKTTGKDSNGFTAQSIGGGGGNGGFNVSGAISLSGKGAGAIGVGVGGMAGDGGDAEKVDASVTGTITTTQDGSVGYLAQSLGGGGGNGGFNVTGNIAGASKGGGALAIGVGGAGGDGGDAGIVIADQKGNITTSGKSANGFVAQSIGGGGGNGGFNVSGNISGGGEGAISVGIGVGGMGGGGGYGKAVTAKVEGDIKTGGEGSQGVVVQSIGGGGGNGGFNVTGNVALSQQTGGVIGVGVGGFAGGGNDAAKVTSTVIGKIDTTGKNATGLFVQSLGGGGGNGGLNVTGGFTGSLENGGTLGIGIGGFGGDAGNGLEVISNSTGAITTKGEGAKGAIIQSLGGAGGTGAINVTAGMTLSGGKSGTIGIGIGGFGGDGGDAFTVNGSHNGDITTEGKDADGIIVQSVGGGGGDGGLNVTGGINASISKSGGLGFGLGGFGGDGGRSNDVTFDVTGNVTTKGDFSDAVTIQSIGGGGGNGAMNVSGTLALSLSGDAGAASLGIGGFGGDGGDAGNVKSTVTGNIVATGANGVSGQVQVIDGIKHWADGSNGVIAQSVGGGGGNGGMNISGAISGSAVFGKSYTVALGLGGFGGGGGDAGTVDLTVKGNVSSLGDKKAAVIAQSIGGGGGDGALNVSGGITFAGQLTAGVGGFAGDGGLGKKVMVDAEGNLSAKGVQSRGLLAQSIGGGGGDGGINISGGLTLSSDSTKPNLVFGLGGFGGEGNKAGEVIAKQNGMIDVEGTDSIGVLAQSIGGGGGSGGLNVSAVLTTGKNYSAAFGIGGNAGDGADGNNVTLTSDGKITVTSSVAISPDAGEDYDRTKENYGERGGGILAQSVGGGGGVGGINASGVISPKGNPIVFGLGGSGGAGGNAGIVTVKRGLTTRALIKTIGDESNGLTAQSVGGGGGMAGMNLGISVSGFGGTEPKQVTIVIGGSGGAAGNGEKVDVTNKGDIETSGKRSDGLFAQSIGGGGGNANLNIGGGINRNSTGFNLAVGGGTGDGGTGGQVLVDHDGNITTKGDESAAIFAQSVGGGGGNTRTSSAVSAGNNNAVTIGIGRHGGAGADAGEVQVTSKGTLSTSGERSNGIVAQSVGGGGGMSSATQVGATVKGSEENDSTKASFNIAVGLQGGDSGIGKKVTVNSSGSISTAGSESAAILAQSIGGGGGIGGGVLNTIVRENVSARIGIGGDGGTGSDAGEVWVDNSATLSTKKEKSAGISAQSTGGGGGIGGYAINATLSLKPKNSEDSNSAVLSVGGTGGNAGDGAKVDVKNRGLITTEGAKSFGIEARSVGGGGGDGGLVFNGTVGVKSTSNSIEMGIGGKGGKGGTAAIVGVLNEGTIKTSGEDAAGIHALSLGGGGGDAGLVANISLSVPTGENTSKRVLFNIGGDGGAGGNSEDVTVTNRPGTDGKGGDIWTTGKKAYGIYAQSIGGGGGNGSSVVSLNFTATGGKNSAIWGLNIGGKGGTGNIAGGVTVVNDGQISTTGEEAYGIYAQSIGGGGGNGGMALAVNAVIASKGTAPVIAIGGFGGSGGDAGKVEVTNNGLIKTTGKNAHGIVAQSIGGGGGNANIGLGIGLDGTGTGPLTSLIANPLAFALGATCVELDCYKGGQGGQVVVNQNGSIEVSGEGAQAIKAESLNGGGGSLVVDFSGISTVPGGSQVPEASLLGFDGNSPIDQQTKTPVMTLIAGGDRVANSAAGAVTINVKGDSTAKGAYGTGVGVQAVGGGGGNISAKFAMDDKDADEMDAMGIKMQLGGTGGSNNKGGDIKDSDLKGEIGVFHDPSTNLNTDLSTGLFVQSIGGGGGRSTIELTTAQGMIANGVHFNLGGKNGSEEEGGDINLTQSGQIYVEGKGSIGSFIQSVGGGGGFATFNLKSTAPAPFAAASSFAALDAPVLLLDPPAVTVTLGNDGGGGGDGGDVNDTKTDPTVTTDDYAIGIFRQSVGAGGGFTRLMGVDYIGVTLGGTNGATGNGGDVTLDNTGLVQTSGFRSHGIFLQSVGGGGGFVLTDAASILSELRAGGIGNGGKITLTQNGDVVVNGKEAFGVAAQSIGGGGGFVQGYVNGSAGGTGVGGAIKLDLKGTVSAQGDRSTAIYAQSVGKDLNGDKGGNIEVALAAGKYAVGGKGGQGVAFDGGATNTFTNNGSVFTLDEIEGLAVSGTWGDDTVLNNLYMEGNVELGKGANGYKNAQVARFDMGKTVDLNGHGNEFLNDGIMAPGASKSIDTVLTTALNGDIKQSAMGHYDVDLDFVAGDALFGRIDRINATGEAALKGKVDLNIVNPSQVAPGHHEETILSADGTVTDKSLILNAPASAVAQYEIIYPNPNDVVLSYDVDFSGKGAGKMNPNQTRFGDYINDLQVTNSKTRLAPLVGYIFGLPTIEDLRAAYAMLTPEAYATNVVSTLTAIDEFGLALMSCRQVSGEYHFVAQGECGWMRASGRQSRYDSSFNYNGYHEDVYQVAAGFQQEVGENKFIGLGFSYESTDGELSSLANTEGDRIQVGVVAKARTGGTTAAASLIGGRGWFDVDRVVALDDIGGIANGKQTMTFAATRLQLAQSFDYNDSYFRLGVDANLSAIFEDDFREHGAQLGNLSIDDHTNVNVSVMPFVEMGGETEIGDGALLRPWAKAGLVQYIEPDTRVFANLIGAPDNVESYYARAGFDKTLGRLDLGLDLLSQGGAVLGLTGTGILGENTEIYQGNIKASIPF